jgi:hypothetical protein
MKHTQLRLTAVFTGPPYELGFQENTDSAAPVQLLLGEIIEAGYCLPQHLTSDSRTKGR